MSKLEVGITSMSYTRLKLRASAAYIYQWWQENARKRLFDRLEELA